VKVVNDDEIILEDENGQEFVFSLFDVLTVDGNNYAVLVPKDDAEEGAIILRFEQDEEGTEVLVSIEDDDEFERVVAELEKLEDVEIVF